jgi:hypothetical protein
MNRYYYENPTNELVDISGNKRQHLKDTINGLATHRTNKSKRDLY